MKLQFHFIQSFLFKMRNASMKFDAGQKYLGHTFSYLFLLIIYCITKPLKITSKDKSERLKDNYGKSMKTLLLFKSHN